MNDEIDAAVFGEGDASGLPDYEIAARDLRALIEGKRVTLDCVPILESPNMDREWQKKAKAASVQCRVSAPCIVAPDYSDNRPGGSASPFPGYAVFWFERYQLDDFTETLARDGTVFFPLGVAGQYPKRLKEAA